MVLATRLLPYGSNLGCFETTIYHDTMGDCGNLKQNIL